MANKVVYNSHCTNKSFIDYIESIVCWKEETWNMKLIHV